MIQSVTWSYPTEIRFGIGRILELGSACQSIGMKRPLLITDEGLAELKITEQALKVVRKSGLDIELFSEVGLNPSEKHLKAGLDVFKAGSHDGVVAFGGGSGIDLGKLVAFMSGQTRPVWDFEDISDWWKRADKNTIAPVIAVPTTAGTGSEVGRASVLVDAVNKTKRIIFHPQILPKIVILDPELTCSLPASLTAGTGMDAFIHCLEAFCSPNFHPMSQGIAVEGMRLVFKFLKRAVDDGFDIEARARLLAAASMGAVAFQKGLGGCHALSHPLGAVYGTHHGTTNAVLIPHILEMNRKVINSDIERLAPYFGISGGFDGFVASISRLNLETGIPVSLAGLGINDLDIPQIVNLAMIDPSGSTNPLKLSSELLASVLEKSR